MNDLLLGATAKSKNKLLEYDDISAYINSEDNLAFLSDIVPKRVPYHKVPGFKKKEETKDAKESETEATKEEAGSETNEAESETDTNMSKAEA